jgi:hypothetical protein
MRKNKTLGLSPKAAAAPIGGVVAAAIADYLGVSSDIILYLIGAIGALLSAVAAPPGNVVAERQFGPVGSESPWNERGYGVIDVLVIILLILLVLWIASLVL